ncbi:putative acetamidase/formamidase [Caulobacter sp. AP07]|uniref:acetamidase/formamidase family protein n=1 Tax=Caulobacter sp. AP07 TaxID=1144304 RepID=UPI00027225AB|nr:acetamidase/formamidase family protein [Caulobacter sp. AP07]EJL24495.1 putative acetamidase/formamidase [Caulobacter sp. AP07]
MRNLVAVLLLLSASPAWAETQTWVLSVDRWGNTERSTLTIEATGEALSGRLNNLAVEGRREKDGLVFSAVDPDGARYRFEASQTGDVLSGWADYPDTNTPDARARHAFTAQRLAIPTGPPQRRTYAPETFSNTFTAERAPVMVVRPGDVIATWTIDSGGVDEHGRTVALYGNPQTGPFFIVGANPGDVLAIHIRKLALNRDYADSLDGITSRAMPLGLAARSAGLGQRVRWRLDRTAGTARLENPPVGLKNYVVPVRPMLGGVGVAPDFGFAPFSAGDTGRFGGNMDFNQIGQGATLYLPVYQPGGLLFLGDGHALQGDGETTQWALETSLDVEFSVEVLPSRALSSPRVETADAITVIGQSSSLDEAVRAATGSMVQWLEQDYGLSVSEASLILGTAAQYRVVTLAGRNAGMALSLEKALFRDLPRKPTK